MLADIRRYFMTRRKATLADLALHFDSDPDAMRGMLAQWIRKGRVVKSDLSACCSHTCSGCCSKTAMELYEWKQ